MHQFTEVYLEGEIRKGRNLLAFEVAKRNVHNFLAIEKKQLADGDAVKILALETKFQRWLEDGRLPYPVLISGNIDRIEQRNGKIRIIDYKTGKVEKGNLVLKNWEGLTADLKNEKAIQLLTYAFMYEPHANGLEMETGIISFKNMKAGFMNFCFKDAFDKTATSEIIDLATLEEFKTQLILLVKEILNAELPFEEKVG